MKSKEEQVSEFKKRADDRNKTLYSDIKSFRFGFVIILAIVSIVFLIFYFLG